MKKALALTLALALLFSTVAGTHLVNIVKANPAPEPNNPIIIMESPTNNTYHIAPLTLNVTIKTMKTLWEGMNIAQTQTRVVTYSLDGESPRPITETSYNNYVSLYSEDVTFTGYAVLPELPEGLHNITVHAEYDYNPYEIHRESDSTVYFRIDSVPQNVSILMPENSTYAPNGVPLQFFVDEPASWIGYSLDGQENVTVARNMTLPELSVGKHTLTLYANDAAGNPATSETIRFKIEPFPTTLIIAIVIIIAVVGIGLLVYFKKRKR